MSQQIKALETSLGTLLFERMPRALRLTVAGQQLLPVASQSLSNLADAIGRLRSPRRIIRLSAAPTFCTRWLVPRLGSFYSLHPSIEVHIDAATRAVDLSSEPFDLAIRRVQGDGSHFYVCRLFSDDVVALCTQSVADMLSGEPANLSRTKLLCWSWQDCWPRWLEITGAGKLENYEQAHFSHLMLVLDAALAGQGVALTSPRLVQQDLELRRLVHVFGPPLPSGYHYAIVARPDAVDTPHVRMFVDWILSEAQDADKCGECLSQEHASA